MKNARHEATVNLSLFETRGEAPGPLQERVSENGFVRPSSPSPEAAFLYRSPSRGGTPGSDGKEVSEAADDPRESLGGKGGATSTPGKDSFQVRSIADLLERSKSNLLSDQREERKRELAAARSTKQELQNWFFRQLAPRWGGKKPLDKRTFGVKTNFLSTRDLFYMQSIYKDTDRRHGAEAAAKEFWGSLKPRDAAP